MLLQSENVDIQKELAAAEQPEVVEVTSEETPAEAIAAEEPVIEQIEEIKVEKPEVRKVVPLAALHEERKKIKELREQISKDKAADGARYEELRQRLERLQNPPPPAPEIPKFDEDPANNLKYEVDQLKRNAAVQSAVNQRVAAEKQIETNLNSSEIEFGKEHADYTDAAQHLLLVMNKNLETFGVVDPAARTNAIRQEIQRMTIMARNAGKQPAELIYEMAKNQGFLGKKVAFKGNEKIESITKGQESSKSLGSGGRSETGALTLETLARMDDDDVTALVSDDKSWARLAKLM